jgi:hypothetical protein
VMASASVSELHKRLAAGPAHVPDAVDLFDCAAVTDPPASSQQPPG